MDKNLDLRIQKTYNALTSSLYAMMIETSFEQIKVKDICDRAMVRKSTFYKHFADKYELLAFMVRRLKDNFDSKIYAERSEVEPVEYYICFVDQIFDFINSNGDFVKSAMQSNSFPLVLNILSEQATPDIRAKLKEDLKKGHKIIAHPDFTASFFVGGIMEIIRIWLVSGKATEETIIKEQITKFIRLAYESAN